MDNQGQQNPGFAAPNYTQPAPPPPNYTQPAPPPPPQATAPMTAGEPYAGAPYGVPSYAAPTQPALNFAPPVSAPPSHYQGPASQPGQSLPGVPPIVVHHFRGGPAPVIPLAFDTWIKVVIGIVSFLKAIPLLILLFAIIVLSGEIDEAFEFDEATRGLVVLFGVILTVAVGLLAAQTYAVMASKKLSFLIFGGLICLIDGLVIIASLDAVAGLGLAGAVIVGQVVAYIAAARTKI